MMKSSIGYHTLSIFQRLSEGEENLLHSEFYDYMKNGGQITKEDKENKKGQVIYTEYAYRKNHSTGIRWQVFNMDVGKGFRIYGVKAIITPKVLLNKDYIAIASESDIQAFKSAFNNEARKISPILEDFNSYSMSRSDYCGNFDLGELKIPCTPEQKMKLIKMGDIPANYKPEYNTTSHRRKTEENSFYVKNDSAAINCYYKYEQMKKDPKHPCANKEDAKSTVRFEMQCKNRKLHAMSKKHVRVETDLESSEPIFFDKQAQEIYEFYRDLIARRRNRIPIEAILSDATSVLMIDKYFRKIVRSGDYYTLVKARQMIESLDCQSRRKEKLIKALKDTNKYRGIYNTKLKLSGNDLLDYKRMLIELDKLRINPVTIPVDWNIEQIPNLLNAYYDKCTEVQNEELRREGEKRLLRNWSK